jgi:hypothetical protein
MKKEKRDRLINFGGGRENMVREHDYELWIDITSDGNYNLHQDLNSFLKPKDLLLISKLLKEQEDKIHQLIIGKENIVKK